MTGRKFITLFLILLLQVPLSASVLSCNDGVPVCSCCDGGGDCCPPDSCQVELPSPARDCIAIQFLDLSDIAVASQLIIDSEPLQPATASRFTEEFLSRSPRDRDFHSRSLLALPPPA